MSLCWSSHKNKQLNSDEAEQQALTGRTLEWASEGLGFMSISATNSVTLVSHPLLSYHEFC